MRNNSPTLPCPQQLPHAISSELRKSRIVPADNASTRHAAIIARSELRPQRRCNPSRSIERSRTHARVPSVRQQSSMHLSETCKPDRLPVRHFMSSRSHLVLHDLRADALMIAGVHLHACVRATALDAYARVTASLWSKIPLRAMIRCMPRSRSVICRNDP